MPDVPGYNPVWDWQPVVTETMRLRGVKPPTSPTTRSSAGRASRTWCGRAARPPAPSTGQRAEGGDRRDQAPVGGGRRAPSAPASPSCASSSGGDPYFLAIDPFDPVDAAEAPPIYVKPGEVDKEGIGPMNGRLVELKFGGGDIDELRDAYRKHVEHVDEWVGRLMDVVPDDVFLFVLGDTGIALGEHDYAGRGTPDLAPPLLRDPVPDPPPARREGRRRHRLVRLHARRGPDAAVLHGPHDPRARCAART